METAFEELLQKVGVTPEVLEKAHERQAEQGGHLRTRLLLLGVFSPETFSKKIEQLLRVPYVNVAEQEIAAAVLTLLPQESAEKYLALPIEFDAKHRRVTIAMADPANMSLLDDLKFVVGHSLIPQYSPKTNFRKKSARHTWLLKTNSLLRLPVVRDSPIFLEIPARFLFLN